MGDANEVLPIQLDRGWQTTDLTTGSLGIHIEKPDGKIVDFDQSNAADRFRGLTNKGYAEITLPPEVYQASGDIAVAYVRHTVGSTVESSSNFQIRVLPAIGSGEASDNYIADAGKIIDDIKTKAAAGQIALDSAKNTATAAQAILTALQKNNLMGVQPLKFTGGDLNDAPMGLIFSANSANSPENSPGTYTWTMVEPNWGQTMQVSWINSSVHMYMRMKWQGDKVWQPWTKIPNNDDMVAAIKAAVKVNSVIGTSGIVAATDAAGNVTLSADQTKVMGIRPQPMSGGDLNNAVDGLVFSAISKNRPGNVDGVWVWTMTDPMFGQKMQIAWENPMTGFRPHMYIRHKWQGANDVYDPWVRIPNDDDMATTIKSITINGASMLKPDANGNVNLIIKGQ
ncbi:hypothetical protein L248_1707 [Schleiferilactobacillus shenzhenensis LY-73]|uniref:BppU N-terminal domain-containing protein n=1 Tax=Schleiferilactobacillus shenzhenensis LY-73 TaxID=1231336 RepID=U4TKZ3_9LACO|nr:hypothetical protein L248_1707 [Schleiferilactobacillus shenzhenensis LY-73]